MTRCGLPWIEPRGLCLIGYSVTPDPSSSRAQQIWLNESNENANEEKDLQVVLEEVQGTDAPRHPEYTVRPAG